MFAVTPGYSTLKKVLLVQERRLLAEREIGATNNQLNTDCLLTYELQWHSKSITVMSHSQ